MKLLLKWLFRDPRSIHYVDVRVVAEDAEYILYSVVLFKRAVDEFTGKAREKKFITRDFKWDPELLSNEKKQLQELVTLEKDQSVLHLIYIGITSSTLPCQLLGIIRIVPAFKSASYIHWIHSEIRPSTWFSTHCGQSSTKEWTQDAGSFEQALCLHWQARCCGPGWSYWWEFAGIARRKGLFPSCAICN